MAIQHSVSQFLTRPWRRHGARKQFVYYDFETDRIEEATPRDLFAKQDVHSQKIDLRFRDLIEAPLGRLAKRVRAEGVKPINDWSEIRAAHLVFFGQTARFADHTLTFPTAEGRKLDALLGLPDAQLDALVMMEMADKDLRLFQLQQGACLFYPETGVVGFPVIEDPQKKLLASVTGGFGIPLDPKILLTEMPKSTHEPWFATLQGLLQAFSVGLQDSSCRRVIVPGEVANQYDWAELATRIKALRLLATDVLRQTVNMQKLINQAQRLAGLAP